MKIEIDKNESKIKPGDIIICNNKSKYMVVKTLNHSKRYTLLNLDRLFITDIARKNIEDLISDYFRNDNDFIIIKSEYITLKLCNGGIKYELYN